MKRFWLDTNPACGIIDTQEKFENAKKLIQNDGNSRNVGTSFNKDGYRKIKQLQKRIDEKNEQLAEYRDERRKQLDLFKLFSPMIFNSIEELDSKIEELDIKIHEQYEPINKLITFAGHMYRKENVKSALYHLKIKRLYGKDLELFLFQDFQEVAKDFYTWINGNISALFVIEFTDENIKLN